MKNISFFILVFGLFFLDCIHNNESKVIDNKETLKNKEEIQILIRKTLNWANSNNSFDLLPAIADDKDSLFIGFDFEKIKTNLEVLKSTGLFSSEFIENYNRIILTLDKKIRNKELNDWQVGELQPFSFAFDINPWCYCQEIPDENPWSRVEISEINLDNNRGELNWTWAKTDWSDSFLYSFRVTKEDGIWKIDYMQGFDYEESTKDNGI